MMDEMIGDSKPAQVSAYKMYFWYMRQRKLPYVFQQKVGQERWTIARIGLGLGLMWARGGPAVNTESYRKIPKAAESYRNQPKSTES